MLAGAGVSVGIGVAQAKIWHNAVDFDYMPRKATHPSRELARFEAARQSILSATSLLRRRTALRLGNDEAAIFDVYQMFLDDEDGLLAPLRQMMLEQYYSADYAVFAQFNEVAGQFGSMDDAYFRQRMDDIISLRDELLRELEGHGRSDLSHLERPTVVVAYNLSPVDLANLDLSRLEGIVCEMGGYTSHLSIIARTLGVPAVVGIENITQNVRNGMLIALDGESGEVWLEPCEEEIQMLHLRGASLAQRQAFMQTYRGCPTISTDGRRVELLANVSQLDEIDAALEADAESIGLYRTEMLHFSGDELPTEDEQFEVYRSMLEKLGGKSATVRTFDDGGHKPPYPFQKRQEANPVLGYRGIRMCLGRPSFFRTQLRALLRASAYGSLKVMFPMMSNLDELDEALFALKQIKQELRREQIPFDDGMQVGVDIEVPASALLSSAIAPKVDFLSIGINDLIQFTLAIDRGNPDLAYLYHQYHPAVLRLVRLTVNAAHASNIPCILCGEAPGQDQILPLMLGLGIDGFSTNPRFILSARHILNNSSYAEWKAMADKVLQLNSTQAVARLLKFNTGPSA